MTGTGGSFLDKILAAKRAELAGARSTRTSSLSDRELLEFGTRLPRPRDFIAALREGPRPAIIAEFKRASPSAGALREDADPRHVATLYAAGGATCMSILTDRHFGGSFDDLRAVRQTVTLPLLCKDFILEKQQIVEAKRVGADCILLIVAALPPPQLRALLEFTHQLELQAAALADAGLDSGQRSGGLAFGEEGFRITGRDSDRLGYRKKHAGHGKARS